MKVKIEESWGKLLEKEFEEEYFEELIGFVKEEYGKEVVYPPGGQIFRAFDLCPVEKVKVVIIGQDPYHGPGQANGLCFSVGKDVKVPPSLRNIFKEIEGDLGSEPKSRDLGFWAKQGVLMLNATLTVKAREAGSHQGKGWERFTNAVIKAVSESCEGVVFLLWGKFAQEKAEMVDQEKHLVLKAAHPSPFSAHRGFFGCGHFSKCNQYLSAIGKSPVDWVGV